MPNAIALAEAVVDAYNAQDFDRLSALIAADLDFAHWNRNFAFDNRDALLDVLRQFADGLVPDRRFEPAERLRAVGEDSVVREGYWTGTAQVDLPGFGAAGSPIRLKFCSVMRFADGLLVEWKDYG